VYTGFLVHHGRYESAEQAALFKVCVCMCVLRCVCVWAFWCIMVAMRAMNKLHCQRCEPMYVF